MISKKLRKYEIIRYNSDFQKVSVLVLGGRENQRKLSFES